MAKRYRGATVTDLKVVEEGRAAATETDSLRAGAVEVDRIPVVRERPVVGPVAADIDSRAVGASQRRATVDLHVVVRAAAGERARLYFYRSLNYQSAEACGAGRIIECQVVVSREARVQSLGARAVIFDGVVCEHILA